MKLFRAKVKLTILVYHFVKGDFFLLWPQFEQISPVLIVNVLWFALYHWKLIEFNFETLFLRGVVHKIEMRRLGVEPRWKRSKEILGQGLFATICYWRNS